MPKRKTKRSTKRKQSGTNGILSHDRNWSELPEDILHLFSKKLHDISDFIHFRAVCKRWKLSALVTDPPPQLPWLLELQSGEHHENNIIRFYCLSSGKVHTITYPGSSLVSLRGLGCHYLLASHLLNNEMYLLNPLTRDCIHVPFVNTSWNPEYIGPDLFEDGDIVVLLLQNGVVDKQRNTRPNMMTFWRPEAREWVHVDGIGDPYSGKAYYMGQYFSNDKETGITNVIDIATKKLTYQVAPPEDTNPLLKGCTIMVESGGKLLRLFQYYEGEQYHFDIYCLDFRDGEGKPCWVKISDIGDQMLFLQSHCGLSVCASDFPGFKGNCIYFLKLMQSLCRYDIGDGATEVLSCPFDLLETWFLPSLV